MVAKLVIAGCNVSRYDSQGMSPGHLAARHGYHQVMDKLLLAGFGLDMQGGLTALHGSVGSTALHIAAQHGHQQVCSYPAGQIQPCAGPHLQGCVNSTVLLVAQHVYHVRKDPTVFWHFWLVCVFDSVVVFLNLEPRWHVAAQQGYLQRHANCCGKGCPAYQALQGSCLSCCWCHYFVSLVSVTQIGVRIPLLSFPFCL